MAGLLEIGLHGDKFSESIIGFELTRENNGQDSTPTN